MRLPEWLAPMAATLTADRLADPGWIFERKLDGIRLLACEKRKPIAGLAAQQILPQADFAIVLQVFVGWTDAITERCPAIRQFASINCRAGDQ